jgi:hypothetical protein
VTGWRADPTPAGFVFEERWEEWYAGLLAFQEYPLEDGKREGGRLGGKLDWCRLLITETREHMAQFPSQRQVGETARTPAVVLDHVQPPLLRQHLRLPTGWLRRGACNIVRCDWADGTNTHDSCHRMAEPTRRPVHSPGGVAGARGETTLRSGLRDFDRTAGGSLPTRPGSRGDVSAMCHPRTV